MPAAVDGKLQEQTFSKPVTRGREHGLILQLDEPGLWSPESRLMDGEREGGTGRFFYPRAKPVTMYLNKSKTKSAIC